MPIKNWLLVLVLTCQMGSGGIYEMRHHIASCPVHGTKVFDVVVPLDKKSFLTDEYIQAVEDLFPYSNRAAFIGLWDAYPIEPRARIEYCPECRKAEETWLRKNPEHRPRIVDQKDILDISQQGDQKSWRYGIHNEPFAWRLTTVNYKVHLTSDYIEARKTIFPNSFFIVEGKMAHGPHFAGMGFCWKCREAERVWCSKHPNLCVAIPPAMNIEKN
jgi:hypothetical protein